MDELGELKRKAVYNATKGTEGNVRTYDIEPIENNIGCSRTLFLADTDFIANVALHTSLPSQDITQL